MENVSRLIGAVVRLAVIAFCCFGFLATFEPLPVATQWTWRAIYAIAGAASLVGIVALATRRRRA